jgi:hypothetical protein
MIKNHLDKILFVFIFGLVSLTVYANISEQRSIDRSKIPEKLEDWIIENRKKKPVQADLLPATIEREIGRASCRERVFAIV